MANSINWFEIPVGDLERAKTFYETILDISITLSEMGSSKMGWFPGEPNDVGATGTLMASEGYIPSQEGTLVYFAVKDIEGTLAKIIANGGLTLMPKTSIGDYGFIAHFQDTEGNRIALHSIQ